jgi:hypothetical protein
MAVASMEGRLKPGDFSTSAAYRYRRRKEAIGDLSLIPAIDGLGEEVLSLNRLL